MVNPNDSKIRRKRAQLQSRRFRVFIVRPQDATFEPNDWRAKPSRFRIISDEGTRSFKGQSDAFRFSFNHEALTNQKFDRWAIAIDCEN